VLSQHERMSSQMRNEVIGGIGYNVGYNYFGEGWGDLVYSLALGIGLTDHG